MSGRPPAVAGSFYPASPSSLREEVDRLLAEGSGAKTRAFGAIVPHAGYIYSGPVAGAVLGSIDVPDSVILLGPNHTGMGAGAALDPHESWTTPLGDAPVDAGLARELAARAPSIVEDPLAHRREHSLEVIVPFLQRANPNVRIVAISIGAVSIELCREIGLAVAGVVAIRKTPPLVVASTDMNHYESRDVARAKNAHAFSRIEAVDPEGLFQTVLEHDITMCGFLPVTAALFAARGSGARSAVRVASSDSGDITGDLDSVVAYAGYVISG